MDKQYISPLCEVATVSQSSVLCASVDPVPDAKFLSVTYGGDVVAD